MAKNKQDITCSFKTSIGGQALIEGILMRGPDKEAIVCVGKDGLIEKTESLTLTKDRYPILGLPFIRGCVTFFDSLVNGMNALTYSAGLIPEDEQTEPDKFDLWIQKHFEAEKAQKIIIGTAVFFGIALSVLLFIILPVFIAGLFKEYLANRIFLNLVEGLIKIVILLVYMKLCSCMKDIKRVFSYHGAEHKTIFCYEHRKPFTVDNVRKESRFHPRCGTSFLLVVVLVSIIVNSFIQEDTTVLRMVYHILLLPVVVGISYEINRWCGKHDNIISRILSAPGKWLQRMTTNEPDDIMIECAIRALELVVPETPGADIWGS